MIEARGKKLSILARGLLYRNRSNTIKKPLEETIVGKGRDSNWPEAYLRDKKRKDNHRLQKGAMIWQYQIALSRF